MSIQGVTGIGANQRYTGVPISLDKPKQPEYEPVKFECHRCHQQVDSLKGYFVEHYRVKIDRYGGPQRVMCNASNNKVRAELRTLTLKGACDQCGTEQELSMTEEYPGGLKQYGGFMKQPCVVCDGKTHATCEECGKDLTQTEHTDNSLGMPVTTTVWVHTADSKPECDNTGEQFFVYDYDQQDPNDPHKYVKVAGPFPTEADAEQEQQNLENAPTASGNENYAVDSESVPPTNAKAFALSIKQNPINEILLYDGFEIEERDDSEFTQQAPFDPSDPASIAAALSGTTSQED